MPLALSPDETYDVTLSGDPSGASFTFRYLTARQFRQTMHLSQDVDERDTGELLDDLVDAIATNLVGWDVVDHAGNPVPFDPDALQDILTVGELWDLYFNARRQNRLTGDEKKDFGSSSHTDGASSATDAGPEETAPTDRPS